MIQMEYVEGQTLDQLLDSVQKGKTTLTHTDIDKIEDQIIEGMKAIRKVGIDNSRVRVKNVHVLQDYNIKLGYFFYTELDQNISIHDSNQDLTLLPKDI